MNSTNAIEINSLSTEFHTESGWLRAIDDVSFSIGAGECVGVVGESGCGKSVTASSILRLLEEGVTRYGGEILLDGVNLLELSEKELRSLRGSKIAMIFQDPMTSLNPVYKVGSQIVEAIRQHRSLPKKQAKQVAIDMLAKTGIPSPEQRFSEYPHQLSGGMQQRVMIAMALSCRPGLLIADEPTTALDVTTQAQVLSLMDELRGELNTAVMLITHDLGVVYESCSRVVIMYLGQVVESSPVSELFERPLHPYTAGLIGSVPAAGSARHEPLATILGSVPGLTNIPEGCRFAARCDYATEQCRTAAPPLQEKGGGRAVRCWYADELDLSQGAMT